MGIPALNDNAWYAYDELQKKYGWKPHQAAAIVGNLMQESTFMTNARNKGDGRDGTDSVGIGQWNGPRAKAFYGFASDNGLDPNSLDTQLGFLNHEMKTSETGAYKRLLAADNLNDATAAMIGYERPRGYSDDNPRAGHGWENRLSWATQVLANDRTGSAPAPVGSMGSLGGSQMMASKQPSITLLGAKQETSQPVETAQAADTEKKSLFPKLLPDTLLGVDTKKGAKALGDFSELMEKQTAQQNAQMQASIAAGQSRRANSEPVQIALQNSRAAIDNIDKSQIPPDLLKALMMLRGTGAMRG